MDITGASAIVTGGAPASVPRSPAPSPPVARSSWCRHQRRARARPSPTRSSGVFARVDVTDTEQIAAAVLAAAELARSGPASTPPGSAGHSAPSVATASSPPRTTSTRSRRSIEINLIGTFDMPRQAATVMSRNEPDADGQRGAIVNLARRGVRRPDRPVVVLRVQGWRRRHDAAGRPRPVRRRHPPQHRRARPGRHPDLRRGPEPEEFKAKLGESVLFPKRLGDAEELACMVVECITNSYMNGETVRVDGGIRMPPK